MRAYATRVENRILVRTEASSAEFEDAKEACKRVAGARWLRSEKAWSYPLAVETCHALRRSFGASLSVLEPLREWYGQAAEQAAAHVDLSRATDATLTRLPADAPALASVLRADQRAGAAWVAQGYRGAGLVADEPGCGKTLVTIAGIIEAGITGPILVACPRLSVKPVWHRELVQRTNERVYIARGTRQKRQRAIDRFMEDPADRKWLIIVSEMLRIKEEKDEATGKPKFSGFEYPSIFETEWAATIVDESHKMFGSLTIAKGNRAGKGLKRLQTTRRYAVTGTPFGKGGRLQGMFGTLHWLWPDEFTSFWRWAGEYFEIEHEDVYIRGGHGRTRQTSRVGGLRHGNEEDFLHSLGPRILRRTKAEVLPNLPPKQYVEIICEMEKDQWKQYRQLGDDAEVTTKGGLITANGVLAEITRSKQLANGIVDVVDDKVVFTGESCKIDMLFQKLEDRGIFDGSGNTKVLITSQFNEFLDAVGKRLQAAGVAYYLLTGKVSSDRKRDKMMEDFQSDGGARVFMLNAKAGGVSVTLDAADELHMLDELWDPGDNQQVEDRVHRASRVHQVTIFQYRTEGTIDTNIGEDVEERRKNQHAVLDGRRGLEYVRDVIKYRKPKEDNEDAA